MVELNETLRREIPLQPIVLTDEEKASKDKDAIIERLQDEAMELYHAKEKEFEDFRQKPGGAVRRRHCSPRTTPPCRTRKASGRWRESFS